MCSHYCFCSRVKLPALNEAVRKVAAKCSEDSDVKIVDETPVVRKKPGRKPQSRKRMTTKAKNTASKKTEEKEQKEEEIAKQISVKDVSVMIRGLSEEQISPKKDNTEDNTPVLEIVDQISDKDDVKPPKQLEDKDDVEQRKQVEVTATIPVRKQTARRGVPLNPAKRNLDRKTLREMKKVENIQEPEDFVQYVVLKNDYEVDVSKSSYEDWLKENKIIAASSEKEEAKENSDVIIEIDTTNGDIRKKDISDESTVTIKSSKTETTKEDKFDDTLTSTMTSIGVQAGAISMNESVAKSTETVNYPLDTSSHLEENSLFSFSEEEIGEHYSNLATSVIACFSAEFKTEERVDHLNKILELLEQDKDEIIRRKKQKHICEDKEAKENWERTFGHATILEKKKEEQGQLEAECKKKEEEERIEAEHKKKEEEERIEAEKKEVQEQLEAEHKKKEEQEQLEAEHKKKEEEERIEAEHKKKEEEERIEAEKKEVQERLEAEHKKKEEQEQLEAERKKKEEEERIEAERKKKEEEERIEAECKKKEEEERIETEKKEVQERLEAEHKKKEEEVGVQAEVEQKEEEVIMMAEVEKNEEEERLKCIEDRKRQKAERKIYLEVKQKYYQEKKDKEPKNVTFSTDCDVLEIDKSEEIDDSHSLDDIVEYIDSPPKPSLNLHTPEIKELELHMEKLLEEHDKKERIVIDTSGCLGNDEECGMCLGTPPPSQMKCFLSKK